MKNFGWLMSVLLLAGVGLVGCGGGDQAPASTQAAGGGATPAMGANDDVKLAFVTNNAADFWTVARAG